MLQKQGCFLSSLRQGVWLALYLSALPMTYAHAKTVEVKVENYVFSPKTIEINAGDTVHWTWVNAGHTVTSGDICSANAGADFESGNLGQGREFSQTFNQVGQVPYFCRPHTRCTNGVAQGMTGLINVVEASTPVDPGTGNKPAQPPLSGSTIPKYAQPLVIPPVIDARNGKPYTLTASEFRTRILPRPYLKTKVWGYNRSYPGPTVLAKRYVAAKATLRNRLVDPSILSSIPIDQTIHWADPLGLGCATKTPPPQECLAQYTGPVPITMHLHGGQTPSAFDGSPNSWFTAGGLKGSEYVSNRYTYPNRQEATTLWYHDHTLGITRLNIYAGLAGLYVLKDPPNEPAALPRGKREVPLVIQDRSFDTDGQLYFPANGTSPDVHPFWRPEFFGDVIVVNGRAWPYTKVEPRRYRFRILNGSNARFFRLKLVHEDGQPGPSMWQIGSDGGYLAHPVKMDELTLAPAERADVVVDFSDLPVRTKLILTNTANAPFPNGDPVDPNTTGQIMQFRVVRRQGRDRSVTMSADLALRTQNPIVDLASVANSGTAPVRRLVLTGAAPLFMSLNNARWMDTVTETPRIGATEVWEIINLMDSTHPMHIHLVQFQLLNRQNLAPNSTADGYAYTDAYNNDFPGGQFQLAAGPPELYGNCYESGVCGGNPDPTPYLAGDPIVPDSTPNEAGWKDTIQAFPGQVTRLVVRWAPQDVPADGTSPGNNLFGFDPTAPLGTVDASGYPGGAGYVWHCHIADHEDNEMMRPLVINP